MNRWKETCRTIARRKQHNHILLTGCSKSTSPSPVSDTCEPCLDTCGVVKWLQRSGTCGAYCQGMPPVPCVRLEVIISVSAGVMCYVASQIFGEWLKLSEVELWPQVSFIV